MTVAIIMQGFSRLTCESRYRPGEVLQVGESFELPGNTPIETDYGTEQFDRRNECTCIKNGNSLILPSYVECKPVCLRENTCDDY